MKSDLMPSAEIEKVHLAKTRWLLIIGKRHDHSVSERQVIGVGDPHPSPPTNFSNK